MLSQDDFPEGKNNILGLPLSGFKDELILCAPDEVKKPPVHDIAARIAVDPLKSYISEYCWRDENWNNYWYHLPYSLMVQVFTTDELVRLCFNSVIMSEVSEMMRYDLRYRIFHKIGNCFWHWGWKQDYNLHVNAYNAIRSFSFGEGFEIYLDHTTGCNDYGYSQYSSWENRLYLDGVFGYKVHYKGKHVLTIGFSVSCYGLLVQQIQLKEKRGNRWLYRLPCHYMEYVVNRLSEAFAGWKLLFVDGESLATAIRRSYGTSGILFPDEKFQHVLKVYSCRFEGYRRSGWRDIRKKRYHYLHQNAS